MLPSMWSCSANEKCTGIGCVLVPTSSSTPWFSQQQAELLEVVAREQVGPGQRGLEAAGPGDEAVAQAAAVGCARHGVGVHPHEGVAGAHPARQALAGDEALHGVAQVVDARVVDLPHLRERGSGVGEAGGGDEGRNEGHVGAIVWIMRDP